MNNEVLILIAAVGAAWLIAHFVVGWLQDRFLFTTGSEYMLIGVLLSPAAFGGLAGAFGWEASPPVSETTLTQLYPIMELAIGWVGLLYGAQLNVKRLFSARDGSLSLSVLSSLVCFVVVAPLCFVVLSAVPLGDLASTSDLVLASVTLASVGAVTSPSVLDLVQRQFGARGPTTQMLRQALRLDELLAIAAFGMVFCVFHTRSTVLEHEVTAVEWYLASVLLGLLLGGLFHFFIGKEHNAEKQFLAFVGITVFAAGAAYYLELSGLLVNMVVGVTMVNVTGSSSDEVLLTLERTRRPMYILLLFFAGAVWVPVGWMGFALAAGYLVLRNAGVFLGGFVASVAQGPRTRRDMGRALLGQGELAVAMALNFMLVFQDRELAEVVFTAVLVSVLANELWSTRLLKDLLIDSGEIRHSVQPGAVRRGR